MKTTSASLSPDYQVLFESAPGLYLVLTPALTIVAVSDAYLRATMTMRENIIGQNLFDVFPDNPNDPQATGAYNLNNSLIRVLRDHTLDIMPVQKYDIRKPESEGGAFEERYWSPVNSPVFDENRNIIYIIHRVEDVTEFVKLKYQRQEQSKENEDLRSRTEQLESEIYLRSQEIAEANRKLQKTNYQTRALLAAIVESSGDAIISQTMDGVITSWNKGAVQLFGYHPQEAIDQSMSLIVPKDKEDEERYIMGQLQEGKQVKYLESERLHKEGRRLQVALTVSPLYDDKGNIIGASKIVHDIGERREAEKAREQLRQAQKMEAIGQLTGGIAHDFNNMLAVILGNLDFLQERSEEFDLIDEFVKPSIEAAEHGAELTRHLLAFGRKQTLVPKVISMNKLIADFSPLVQRTLGERVEIITKLDPDLWNVNIDAAQFEGALLNLSVNARDAMPGGGKLIYETHNIHLDEEYAAQNADITSGDYVLVAISDTGEGMPPEVMEKAFNPFFTTKEVGKVSGLGLSMVYGFVKQSSGHIKLYSELGLGTSVKIYLPRAQAELSPAMKNEKSPLPAENKSKLILIVEDSKNVLKLTSAMVESLGYNVLLTTTGDGAMEMLRVRDDIDLLLTDVMLMGEINGPDLAKQAVELHPKMKVLFNSGYAEHAILQSGILEEGVHLISKPFRKQQLAKKLTELLK